MDTQNTRLPLDRDEIVLLEEPELSKPTCRKLLEFYQGYHQANLVFFLTIREDWLRQNPGRAFPGLCANVNPISGQQRPPSEQRLWGWGDGRSLGTWSSFLISDRVPDIEVTLVLSDGKEKTVDLRTGLRAYVDLIHDGLVERLHLNNHRIPFAAHFETGRADDDPRFAYWDRGEIDFCSIFASNGFIQYGLLAENRSSFERGVAMLEDQVAKISIPESPDAIRTHGPRMIVLGVIGEVLKTMQVRIRSGDFDPDALREKLIRTALPFIGYILDNHYRREPPGFWEHSDKDGNPAPDDNGHILVDPGHATECAGFLAELVPFLPEQWEDSEWNRDRVLQAALDLHLFADRIGFTEAGVMTKFADLSTGAILPDVQAVPDGSTPTAPWFSVREHSASALRLYTLTGDERLLKSYQKAQNASYLHYPNKRIGGQMVQTLHPLTLEVLDIAPATGNLDPMHDGRSRVREMENLERLIGAR
jgi:hypothetical protein